MAVSGHLQENNFDRMNESWCVGSELGNKWERQCGGSELHEYSLTKLHVKAKGEEWYSEM